MVIIGCGTGRCGSQSLANLFHIQENITAYHELYLQGPRYFGSTKSIRYLCNMNQSGYSKDEFINQFYNVVKDNKNKIVFDIGPYYIDIIQEIINWEDIKIISLERNANLFAKSLLDKYCNKSYHGFFKTERFKNLLRYSLPDADAISEDDFLLFHKRFYSKLKDKRILKLKTEELNDESLALKLSEFLNIDFKFKKFNISK